MHRVFLETPVLPALKTRDNGKEEQRECFAAETYSAFHVQGKQPLKEASNELTFPVSRLNVERNKKPEYLSWAVAASAQAVLLYKYVFHHASISRFSYAMVTGQDKPPEKEGEKQHPDR